MVLCTAWCITKNGTKSQISEIFYAAINNRDNVSRLEFKDLK